MAQLQGQAEEERAHIMEAFVTGMNQFMKNIENMNKLLINTNATIESALKKLNNTLKKYKKMDEFDSIDTNQEKLIHL